MDDNIDQTYGISAKHKYFQDLGKKPIIERGFTTLFNDMYDNGILTQRVKNVYVEAKTHLTVGEEVDYLDLKFDFN